MDSSVLLDLLVKCGFEVVVAHLNHNLRGEAADRDAKCAEALAAARGCAFHLHSCDVAKRAEETGDSVETAGREIRRSWFAEVASRAGTEIICLAHHADDQAETLLWNLVRGCGLHGAGGMAPDDWQVIDGRRLRILRPLLGCREVELERYAFRHKLDWREDLSNESLAHTRNRIRLEAIPALAAACGRDPVPGLARFAELARGDDDLIDGLTAATLQRLVDESGSLEAKVFRAWAMPLQRRLVAMWLGRGGVRRVGLAEADAVLKVACSTGRPARVQLSGGWRVRRTGGRLFLERTAAEGKE